MKTLSYFTLLTGLAMNVSGVLAIFGLLKDNDEIAMKALLSCLVCSTLFCGGLAIMLIVR